MVTEISAGQFTIRGRSLGGMYTSLLVPELNSLFDVGTALRAGAGVRRLFISHGHLDHIGALPALLGMRGLTGVRDPLHIYLPVDYVENLKQALDGFSAMHRWSLDVEIFGMQPGDVIQLHRDLHVRGFRTLHPVPSLGFFFFRRVKKLRAEFHELPGAEIATRRRAGEDLFVETERPELAYATDTLPEVLDRYPELCTVPNLIMECTFLDERKTVADARKGCHIHLAELEGWFSRLKNQNLVLMHFSQMYSPEEVHSILESRMPTELFERVKPLAPNTGAWWD